MDYRCFEYRRAETVTKRGGKRTESVEYGYEWKVGLGVVDDRGGGAGGDAVGKSTSEDGDEDDEWDVRDQGGTCHDAAAESPRSRICGYEEKVVNID
jgi:hypothetical protein